MRGLASLLLAATVAVATPTFAETVRLKADLKGANSVPPNTTTGTGSVDATFDTASKVLTYTVVYSGLSGPAVAAHFHGPADPGKNAGIIVHFTPAQSPIRGTATLNDAQVADLLAGKWYANVHTSAHPGGEIRGHLAK
jgi:hypothetical protein